MRRTVSLSRSPPESSADAVRRAQRVHALGSGGARSPESSPGLSPVPHVSRAFR